MNTSVSEAGAEASSSELLVRCTDFTPVPYEPVWRAMQSFTQTRDSETQDELWLLNHQAVFTQGQAGKPEHILAPGTIPVVKIDRGGQVTYHGPGQLVVYLMLDVRRRKLGVRDLVENIEGAVIDVLTEYGIDAQPDRKAPGVYVNSAKIAALGLRIRQGCSYHGLSFNIAMDLAPFGRINPCGYQGMPVTQLIDLATLKQQDTELLRSIGRQVSGAIARRLNYDKVSYLEVDSLLDQPVSKQT
ncbi:MAG: lipoyl(octanoyl) transferase LipB [Pseudohongiellaceae bacterium]|nr:lipoyl(octanoyl) transferase LipB [Pseudohongiellaceae bacterium]